MAVEFIILFLTTTTAQLLDIIMLKNIDINNCQQC